jgi:hypothetical protein
MKPMSRQVVAASLFAGRVCYLLALAAVIYLQTQRLPLEPHTLAVKKNQNSIAVSSNFWNFG